MPCDCGYGPLSRDETGVVFHCVASHVSTLDVGWLIMHYVHDVAVRIPVLVCNFQEPDNTPGGWVDNLMSFATMAEAFRYGLEKYAEDWQTRDAERDGVLEDSVLGIKLLFPRSRLALRNRDQSSGYLAYLADVIEVDAVPCVFCSAPLSPQAPCFLDRKHGPGEGATAGQAREHVLGTNKPLSSSELACLYP